MTRTEALVVAVRLFAIAIVLYSIRAFPGSLAAVSFAPIEAPMTTTVLVGIHLAMIVLAVGLWKYPYGAAALLLPPPSGTTEEKLPWTQDSAIETSCIVIGLFYLTYAISDLMYWISFLVAWSRLAPGEFRPNAEQVAGMFTTLIEVVLALFLIVRASGVARVIRKVRYAGQKSSN